MKLYIENFRSIKKQEVELAPITVVYGQNGAGKSSLLYVLLTLKNIALNPNQGSSGFFNYGFASLGAFDAVAFDHKKDSSILLGVETNDTAVPITYKVVIRENEIRMNLSSPHPRVDLDLMVPLPYPANQQIQQVIAAGEWDEKAQFNINWNGLTSQVQPLQPTKESVESAALLSSVLNAPVNLVSQSDVVPLKRGFTKPYYSPVPVSPYLVTEDELATHLSNDKYLVSKVSFYLEQILSRDFRTNTKPGTAIFSLDATDKLTGVASELVNEGFGVNQLVYLLAKALRDDSRWVGIEEPEIHLHPTAIRKLARAFARITREEGNKFIISTHSIDFVMALIAVVAEGELPPSDLACYWAQKDKKITRFERQLVNEKGQIEGGLSNFVEGELEDLKALLKVPE
jgi:hypothetical protein